MASLNVVDLLKFDCEGAEYDILLSSGAPELSRVRSIRLEEHPGPKERLINHLERHKFAVSEIHDVSGADGYIVFINSRLQGGANSGSDDCSRVHTTCSDAC